MQEPTIEALIELVGCLIQPGSTRRREMHTESRALNQPGAHIGVFVRGVVVHDQVDIQILGDVLFNTTKKREELLVKVPWFALAQYRAVGDVRRREQGGGAMADSGFRYRPTLA